MDKHETWSRLEVLLTSALEAEQHHLPAQDTETVREYIENREYGLAYEHLSDTLVAKRVLVTEKTNLALQTAATLMNL
ncbi:hypothetical protein RCO27_08250 [Sphingosinicella sp. LHD-64]|uniref:hypothetical protein n=1 Tax=Sphingosinicella sp. LHD-64 TaxID=3072139 RepID=UPI00280D50B3|nr:hypothetical protein [Sphingosinicella sp. LHD-64]MDQ8756222.1 hypothetical protein [Sphingosinicella sp. LHD-64]